LLGCVTLAALVLFGCSHNSVDSDTHGTSSVNMNLKLSTHALIDLVETFIVTVTADDMDTTIIETLERQGRYVVGTVEVPAGRDRIFVIEAIDDQERTFYRSVDTLDVEANTTNSLEVVLEPDMSLVRLFPRLMQVSPSQTFSLSVRVYKVPNLYGISFRISGWDGVQVNPLSAVPGSSLGGDVIFFDTVDYNAGAYAFSIVGIDQATPIVDAEGNAELVTVYFSSNELPGTAGSVPLSIEVTEMRRPDGSFITLTDVATDGSLIEISTNPVIYFPDPVLDEVVRLRVGKPTGDLYLLDVQPIDSLWIVDRGVSDLRGLSYMSNLWLLVLSLNDITYIDEMSGLTNLQVLWLISNQVSDLSPLSDLVNLRLLYLGYNDISDLSAIAGLINLEGLLLGGNQISDVSPLAGMTGLLALDLSENLITDITPLANVSGLNGLSISSNQISDIATIAGLSSLIGLVADNCQIVSIVALSDLAQLDIVDLSGNLITDISPLVSNLGISDGDEIDLTGNPLDSLSINVHIPALEDRGVVVTF